jgi:GNAT superfamily N-acetyltransferase
MQCDPLSLIHEMEVAADLARVREIWLSGAKDAHTRIPEVFWDQRLSAFVEEAQGAEERYVCKDEGSGITGFLLADPRANRSCYIFELYVDAPFRKQGIATALFNTLKGQNPRFPRLEGRYGVFTSSVYAHNDRSVAWHIKNEFKICGIMFCPHTGLPKFEMVWRRERAVD